MRNHGFTLAELITVIVILGALAAVAAPRLVDTETFKARGFHDQALGVVRYAQKTAIAWRRTIKVCVTASTIFAISSGTCAAPVILSHPSTGGQLLAQAPAGVTLSPTGEFEFHALGNTPGAYTISISGTPSRQILVAAETGYVSPN